MTTTNTRNWDEERHGEQGPNDPGIFFLILSFYLSNYFLYRYHTCDGDDEQCGVAMMVDGKATRWWTLRRSFLLWDIGWDQKRRHCGVSKGHQPQKTDQSTWTHVPIYKVIFVPSSVFPSSFCSHTVFSVKFPIYIVVIVSIFGLQCRWIKPQALLELESRQATNSRKYFRSNQNLFTHPIPYILTNKRTGGVFGKPQTLLSIWSHELAKCSSNVGVGVGGNEQLTLVASPCIDVLAVAVQHELSAIVDARPRVLAEGTIVQFSIILRFAVCHSENDLRAGIVPHSDTKLFAIV